MTSLHVAIVGGGYSGTLQAVQLLRRGARVSLIERAGRLCRGVAYSTPHPEHLLNVDVARMSAFPDEAGHFADWWTARGGEASDFAPRRDYGRYVGDIFEAARGEAGDRLRVLKGEAVDILPRTGGETILLGSGESIEAEAAILALGNLEPSSAPIGAASDRVFVTDPWGTDVAAGLGSGDTILLIGTGLTAVDAILRLESAGFQGRIVALSRRGLLPRAHAAVPERPPGLEAVPQLQLSWLVRFVRREAEGMGWRAAVDQMRPATQALWAGASQEQRLRFLRHVRTWWEVHRHRIAPSVAAKIEALERGGRLVFRSGKILATAANAGGAEVRWRPRGGAEVSTLQVARVVNCTGPELDISRAKDPLLDRLLAAGRIRPDGCRIGIDVDLDCRALAEDGTPSDSLLAIGPMTRSAFWEVVAVPDIRAQVEALASRLAA